MSSKEQWLSSYTWFALIAGAVIAILAAATGGGVGGLVIGAFASVVIYIYLLPTNIASERNHINIVSIFFVNLLLGWALIPWILCMVWAMHKNEAVEILKSQFANQDNVLNEKPKQDITTRKYAPIGDAEAEFYGEAAKPKKAMKQCPFCAEDVLAAAIKCKHCGSDLGPA